MPTLWMVNTRSCNFNCVYCFQGSHAWTWQRNKGLVKNMPTQVIDDMFPWVLEWAHDRWAERGKFKPPVPEARFAWYGGEPLVNWTTMKYGVVKLDQVFKSKGWEISQGITTNGSLVTNDILHFLNLYNMGMLLSIDGPPWIHNKQRVYHGGKPTWDDIPTKAILASMPRLEIAWQLDPRTKVTMDDVEWMIEYGFHRINFNINSIVQWDAEAQMWLTELMKNVGRACIQTEKNIRPQGEGLSSNMWHKMKQGIDLWSSGKDRGEKPCGTSLNMLALTPEGWLFPSQEMAFNTCEPDRAPGTMEYYRVGNIYNTPVIDPVAVNRAMDIYVNQMNEPTELGFNCQNCVARKLSFGGCHCRYVGQDGVNPAHRHTVMPGWCQHSQAYWNGLLQAAMIEGVLNRMPIGKEQNNVKGSNRRHAETRI